MKDMPHQRSAKERNVCVASRSIVTFHMVGKNFRDARKDDPGPRVPESHNNA